MRVKVKPWTQTHFLFLPLSSSLTCSHNLHPSLLFTHSLYLPCDHFLCLFKHTQTTFCVFHSHLHTQLPSISYIYLLLTNTLHQSRSSLQTLPFSLYRNKHPFYISFLITLVSLSHFISCLFHTLSLSPSIFSLLFLLIFRTLSFSFSLSSSLS